MYPTCMSTGPNLFFSWITPITTTFPSSISLSPILIDVSQLHKKSCQLWELLSQTQMKSLCLIRGHSHHQKSRHQLRSRSSYQPQATPARRSWSKQTQWYKAPILQRQTQNLTPRPIITVNPGDWMAVKKHKQQESGQYADTRVQISCYNKPWIFKHS